MSDAIEFRCEFRNVGWSAPVGSAYTCDYAQVTNQNNSTSLDSVQGYHLDGKRNSDVKALWVEWTKLEKLPTNIETFLPNLEVLLWAAGNLVAITADDLRPFPEMKFLSLHNNKIVSLDSDLFHHSPKLVRFEIFVNEIRNVGYDLLANLKELTAVQFSGNPCISFYATTPEVILELKERLVTQCPPLTGTAPTSSTSKTTISAKAADPSCDVRCTVNDEMDEVMKAIEVLMEVKEDQSQIVYNQNEKNAKQGQINDQLQKTVNSQNEVNDKNEIRILELERQMR